MNRESLIKALWPNTVVEEANLNVHISALRKALAESQGEQRYIETLPRLGYRFIAPVTVAPDPGGASSEVDLPSALVNPEDSKSPAPDPPQKLRGENGANNSLHGAPLTFNSSKSPSDWFSRYRLTVLTLPIWLSAIALLGILAVLYFTPSHPPQSARAAN